MINIFFNKILQVPEMQVMLQAIAKRVDTRSLLLGTFQIFDLFRPVAGGGAERD